MERTRHVQQSPPWRMEGHVVRSISQQSVAQIGLLRASLKRSRNLEVEFWPHEQEQSGGLEHVEVCCSLNPFSSKSFAPMCWDFSFICRQMICTIKLRHKDSILRTPQVAYQQHLCLYPQQTVFFFFFWSMQVPLQNYKCKSSAERWFDWIKRHPLKGRGKSLFADTHIKPNTETNTPVSKNEGLPCHSSATLGVDLRLPSHVINEARRLRVATCTSEGTSMCDFLEATGLSCTAGAILMMSPLGSSGLPSLASA